MGRTDAARLLAMWLLLGSAAALSALLGDRIPRNGGFGFEAFTIYKPITQHLPEYLERRKIDSYTIQRVLPFVLAHYSLRALGVPLADKSILLFFQTYDLAVLALAAWLWLLLAQIHRLSAAAQWLGFLGLFVNFAVAKLTFYYPVSLDTTALLLGLAMLCCYERSSVAGLLLVSMASLFVWPTTVLVGSILLLLPARQRWPERAGPPSVLTDGTLLLVAIGVALFFAYALVVRRVTPPSGGAEAVLELLPISLMAVVAYLFFGLRTLLGPLRLVSRETLSALKQKMSFSRLLAVGALWAVYWFATQVLAAPGRPRLTTKDYLLNLVSLGAAARPAQFLVSHVVYFGPILLFVMLTWPAVARQVRFLGAGMTAVVVFTLLLGVNCESRQFINLLPMLVLPAVLAAEELPLTRSMVGTTAAFAVLLSKCWLPINYTARRLGEAGESFPTGAGSYLEFPAQIYFMSFGPWMSNRLLLLQAGVVAGMGLWLYLRYLRPSARPSSLPTA